MDAGAFPHDSYTLLDCGGLRRLERFGPLTVARPAPAATFPPSLAADAWDAADLRFSRERGWEGAAPDDWRVRFGQTVMSLRPAGGGQIGVFPEHAAVASRLDAVLDAVPAPEGGRRALNLFAHTGLATLRLAARSDVAVTAHVDAAPAAVRQARENASLSGLSHAPVRWLVDDVLTFLAREKRRGNSHDVILADPPAFGRMKGGGEWKLARDLPGLLAAVDALLPDRGGVLALTCHSEGLDGSRLVGTMRRTMKKLATYETMPLSLEAGDGRNALPAGFLILGVGPPTS